MTVPGAAPAEIRLIGLEKRFGEVRAVDGVSLEIGAGEFFSLLGPSGCGKTTTLRMIGGFELPTAGRILLRDRDVTTDPPDKRPVNMVFQNYALFPHLDVGDNIGFGLRRKKVDKADIRRRVGEVLDLVGLGGYEKRRPNQLSGGQQQRVALARALVNRPNVLLLDEPLGALDLKLRKRLQVELKRIQGEVGITFVYVTHDQEEALTMSDRIAVMHGGQRRAARARPRSSTTGRRPGSSPTSSARRTCCTGAVESVDPAGCRSYGSTVATSVSSAAPGLDVGQAIELSIRPESIAPHAVQRRSPTRTEPIARHRRAGRPTSAAMSNTRSARAAAWRSPHSYPRPASGLPVGSDVDVVWSPGEALVLADRPGDRGGDVVMTHRTTARRSTSSASSSGTWPSGGSAAANCSNGWRPSA